MMASGAHLGSRNNDSHPSSSTTVRYPSASASTHVSKPEDAQTAPKKTPCDVVDRKPLYLFSHPISRSYLFTAGPTQRATTSTSNRQPIPTIVAPPMQMMTSGAGPGPRNNDSHASSTTTATYHTATSAFTFTNPEVVDRKPFHLFSHPYPILISPLQSKKA